MKTLTLNDILIKAQPVELKHGDAAVTVYVRPLSEVERELAQAGARGASRRYRRVLEDPKTEDHQLLVAEAVEEHSLDSLRDLWVQSKLYDRAVAINTESLENRDKTYVPEPEGDNVSQADMEHWENEVEDVEEQRETSVMSAINSAKRQLEEEVKKITKKNLVAAAQPSIIDGILGQYFQREYAFHMIARATFKDEACTKPFFKTTEDVRSLMPTMLEQLTNAHFGLLVEPEALKTSGGE